MDWTYKHFTQEAVFGALRESVLEAARAVVAESFGPVEDSPDGFVARGRSGWHSATATFRIEPAQNGTKVAIELLVARATLRGFMLVDIGGFYDGQLRRWLSDIGRQLGQPPVFMSRPSVQHGCLTGCVDYLVVGTGLAFLAMPLDRLVLLPPSMPLPGPAMLVASSIGLLAGIVAFLYALYPEASIWNGVRERLKTRRN
jgi:hypothetical protein